MMNSKIRQRTKWIYPTKTNGKNNRIYNIWNGMQQRCFNKNNAEYEKYSKTSICEEWKNNYLIFEKWALENGYKKGLTIDRINPDEDYKPSNCRWITRSENSKRVIHKKEDKSE